MICIGLIFIEKLPLRERWDSLKPVLLEPFLWWGRLGEVCGLAVLQEEGRRCLEPCRGIKEKLWAGPGARLSPG